MDNTQPKREPKEREFICQMCGDKFYTFATHATYCRYCRDKRANERAKKHRENKNPRKIGSEQICPECGKTFILKSGVQKVCDNCRKAYTNKRKSKTDYEYRKKTYDSCTFYVAKGKKQDFQNWAEQHKMSFNEFVNTALEQFIEHIEKVSKDNS